MEPADPGERHPYTGPSRTDRPPVAPLSEPAPAPYGAPTSQPPYGTGSPPSPGYPAHPAPPGYPGYPPPYGYQAYSPPPPSRVSVPVVGWCLLAAAVLLVIGSVLPWASALGGAVTKAGTDGDGTLTLILALLIGAGAVLIGVRQGRLWVSIVCVVLSALVVLIALADLGDVHDKSDRSNGLISIGSGLWLTFVGGLLTLAASILALVMRRHRPPRPEQPWPAQQAAPW